ncbi:hypothetical protein ABD91_00695 [Lysinibacillus sphaericus]|uniref:hypothetical protein n=1 Tax=Lysinibacillus sphaericus TaxID=1421 RepID=UPI0018CEEF86|nr:hypothetical protein [Lysinibacillus sphaericus]MBG9689445.1 hypothetical protein [Lysinibacillus sphaericus]
MSLIVNLRSEIIVGVVVAIIFFLLGHGSKYLILLFNKKFKILRRWYRRKYKYVASGLDQYNIVLKISNNEELTKWERKVYDKSMNNSKK